MNIETFDGTRLILSKIKRENHKKLMNKCLHIFIIICFIINVLVQQQTSSATSYNTQLFKKMIYTLDKTSQTLVSALTPKQYAPMVKSAADMMAEPLILLIIQKILTGNHKLVFSTTELSSIMIGFRPNDQYKNLGRVGTYMDRFVDTMSTVLTGTTKDVKIHMQLRSIMSNLVICMTFVLLKEFRNIMPYLSNEIVLFRLSLKKNYSDRNITRIKQFITHNNKSFGKITL